MNTDGSGFDTYKGLIVEVYTGGVFIVSEYCISVCCAVKI